MDVLLPAASAERLSDVLNHENRRWEDPLPPLTR